MGHTVIKPATYGAATAMMLCTDYANGTEFNLYTSNIIILLLSNMAFFSSLTYLLTNEDSGAGSIGRHRALCAGQRDMGTSYVGLHTTSIDVPL